MSRNRSRWPWAAADYYGCGGAERVDLSQPQLARARGGEAHPDVLLDPAADQQAVEVPQLKALAAEMRHLDGLLVSGGIKQDVGVSLAAALALGELGLLAQVNAFGATAGVIVAQAAQAIASGSATTVACVGFADTPLQRGAARRGVGCAQERRPHARGLAAWNLASGAASPNILYALCARRHMEQYGTTSRQLGEIAVAQRAWAASNPRAAMRQPLTLVEHQASRWIAEPLHLLDCCLVSNGAVAIIVTSADRVSYLRRPPVHVWGFGQAHAPRQLRAGSDWGVVTPAARSGPQAMRMAGIGVNDVDVCELYDCYTYTVLVTLEDYGLLPEGRGRPLRRRREARAGREARL